MEKIKSVLIEDGQTCDLSTKYEEIYSQSDVWLYKKSQGVHSVILNAIKEELDGASYLDLGCGAGRLPIMCSSFADHALGVDFSHKAIELAKLCSRLTRATNIEFRVNNLENFYLSRSSSNYDIISMVGLLEHVPDPKRVLINVANLLKPGGLLVVACPNFLNFRGATYMTLKSLFDLPMSLADLWQIDVRHIEGWSSVAGLQLEKTLGAIYNFSWAQKASKDMQKRVPLAFNDKGLPIDVNYPSYNMWLERATSFNQDLLKWLYDLGILKSIVKPGQLTVHRQEGIPDTLWEKIREYLEEDTVSDPYWSDSSPWCYFGGEGIYFLRKY